MSAFVTPETTVAYRVPSTGRRFFTKRAAYRAAAKAKLKQRCECEEAITAERYPGNVCEIHSDQPRYQKIVRRLALKYRMADASSQETPR